MNFKKLFTISTRDKSLFIFIMLLIFQQIYSIFFITAVSNIDNSLDVVFRTSLASIFGYLLSSRFAKTNSNNGVKPNNLANTSSINTNTIGFNSPNSKNYTSDKYTAILSVDTSPETKDSATSNLATSKSVDSSNDDTNTTTKYEENYCQVIITTLIGLLALLTLMFYRNYVSSDDAPIAAVSQLRDILSGSIGFLIGTTSSK